MNKDEAHTLVDKIFAGIETTKSSFQDFLKSISPSEENLEKNTKDLRNLDFSPESVTRYFYNGKEVVESKKGEYVSFEDYKALYELFKRVSLRLDELEMKG